MIRFAEINDIDKIMQFINDEWKENHILARNKSFFQYMYVRDEKVNFVISCDKHNAINGILGFIPYDKNYEQISFAVWKALRSADGMIGMALLNFIEKELQPKVITTPGINPKTTIPIYKFLGYEVGKMKHYYRLVPKENYQIAVVYNKCIKNVLLKSDITFKEIHSFEEYKNIDIIFEKEAIKKELWYIEQRYFSHPIYKYRCFLIKENETSLIVITREQEIESAKCLRIVDMIGNYSILSDATNHVDNVLKSGGYEYIDCYVNGIEKETFINAGWNDIDDTDTIIPNYFAPFERRNIDIYYSCKPQKRVIFRGDGDQDRPN